MLRASLLAPGLGELALDDRQGLLMIGRALGGALGNVLSGLLVVLEHPQAEGWATERIGFVVALDLDDSATIAIHEAPAFGERLALVEGAPALIVERHWVSVSILCVL